MRVTNGKVIEGKVVVEGLPLEEGAVVTVLAREAEETFRLSPEEKAELLLSIGEADRGETVSLEEVLEKLPGPGLDGGIWPSANPSRRAPYSTGGGVVGVESPSRTRRRKARDERGV